MKPTELKLEKTTFAIAGVIAIIAGTRPSQALERLFVNGVEIKPEQSLKIRNHSPSGFAWGYSESGAAQTALAICLHIFQDAAVAEAVYQDFKVQFVSRWPLAEPFNVQVDITNFLLDRWAVVSKAYRCSHNQNYPDET